FEDSKDTIENLLMNLEGIKCLISMFHRILLHSHHASPTRAIHPIQASSLRSKLPNHGISFYIRIYFKKKTRIVRMPQGWLNKKPITIETKRPLPAPLFYAKVMCISSFSFPKSS